MLRNEQRIHYVGRHQGYTRTTTPRERRSVLACKRLTAPFLPLPMATLITMSLDAGQEQLEAAVTTLSLSARACDVVLPVSRMIADLEGKASRRASAYESSRSTTCPCGSIPVKDPGIPPLPSRQLAPPLTISESVSA